MVLLDEEGGRGLTLLIVESAQGLVGVRVGDEERGFLGLTSPDLGCQTDGLETKEVFDAYHGRKHG